MEVSACARRMCGVVVSRCPGTEFAEDFSIIALGAVAEVSDDRSVAYLYRGGHVRFLNLYWFGLGWFEYFRFAAVHK